MTRAVADAYTDTVGAWAVGPELVYGRLATVLLGCSPVPMAGRCTAISTGSTTAPT